MRTDPSGESVPAPSATSARELRDALRAAGKRLTPIGGGLNEGARRVLARLESIAQARGMRRAYLKTGKRVTMWDLLSDQELAARGFAPTRRPSCPVLSSHPIRQDRVTCWMSESDAVGELWIGEPLAS